MLELGTIDCDLYFQLVSLLALLISFIHTLDSHEIHSEDDKGHVGKLKARIMKTPAQLEGLEKFYQGNNSY